MTLSTAPSKILGVVALGVMSGSLLVGTKVVLPTIKDIILYSSSAGKTTSDLSAIITKIARKSFRIFTRLSVIGVGSLLFSFVAGKKKHPYLLYTVATLAVNAAVGYFKLFPIYVDLVSGVDFSTVNALSASPKPEESSVDASIVMVNSDEGLDSKAKAESTAEQTINTQELITKVDKAGRVLTGLFSVSFLGFILGAVGIYGDFA